VLIYLFIDNVFGNILVRIQFVRAHQNWTVEDWKNVAWSDESRFLLRDSDGVWCKQNENMDPSCLVTTVQAGGVMVWGMFSWHTLGVLNAMAPGQNQIPSECLNRNRDSSD